MAQFGKNSGWHHVTIYEAVSSVVNKRSYSSDEVFKHDIATLDVFAFTHQIFFTSMPSEIVGQLSDLAAAVIMEIAWQLILSLKVNWIFCNSGLSDVTNLVLDTVLTLKGKILLPFC